MIAKTRIAPSICRPPLLRRGRREKLWGGVKTRITSSCKACRIRLAYLSPPCTSCCLPLDCRHPLCSKRSMLCELVCFGVCIPLSLQLLPSSKHPVIHISTMASTKKSDTSTHLMRNLYHKTLLLTSRIA